MLGRSARKYLTPQQELIASQHFARPVQLSRGCQIPVLRTGLRRQVELLLDPDSPRLSMRDIAIFRRLRISCVKNPYNPLLHTVDVACKVKS
jgi:hypothetical protein